MDFRMLGVGVLGYMVLKSSLHSRVPVPGSPLQGYLAHKKHPPRRTLQCLTPR
jgi:hypothetical protein